MSLTLQPVEGPPLKALTLKVNTPPVILGRHAACGVVLKSEFVSRRHASIVCTAGVWTITDLDSKDGIHIDSICIEPQEPTALHDGELITVGPWVFVVKGTGTAFDIESVEFEASDSMPTNTEMLLELHDSASTKRERAWRSFFKRYEQVICGIARRMGLSGDEVDDTVQDVLYGIIRAGDQGYDENKGRFRAYLKTATKNAIVRRWQQLKPDSSELPDVEAELFEMQWERRWREHVLQLALQSVQMMVTPDQYEAFELFGRRGVSAQQTGQRLGITADKVRSIKKRVMDLVRAEMKRLDDAQ